MESTNNIGLGVLQRLCRLLLEDYVVFYLKVFVFCKHDAVFYLVFVVCKYGVVFKFLVFCKYCKYDGFDYLKAYAV